MSWANIGVDNVVLSKQRALVGETLSASCDVHSEPQTRRPVLIYWVRQTPNKRQVEISVNRGLNDEFRRTGRYSLAYDTLDGMRHMRFKLNITGKPSSLIYSRITIRFGFNCNYFSSVDKLTLSEPSWTLIICRFFISLCCFTACISCQHLASIIPYSCIQWMHE